MRRKTFQNVLSLMESIGEEETDRHHLPRKKEEKKGKGRHILL